MRHRVNPCSGNCDMNCQCQPEYQVHIRYKCIWICLDNLGDIDESIHEYVVITVIYAHIECTHNYEQC